MWKNCFSQLLNVHNVSDVKQTEIHTAEPLVPGSSHLELETVTAKLKKYKSRSSDQVPIITLGYGLYESNISHFESKLHV
jgi:hypothetical protein